MLSTIPDIDRYPISFELSSLVEKAPKPPEYDTFLIKLEQKRATSTFSYDENVVSSSAVISDPSGFYVSDNDLVGAINELRAYLSEGIVSVPADVQDFVDKNFSKLLWN